MPCINVRHWGKKKCNFKATYELHEKNVRQNLKLYKRLNIKY